MQTTINQRSTAIIYWTGTGIISLMMLFSFYQYLNNPQVAAGFTHLGFPAYFRVELAIAKLLGAIALLLPMVPAKIKEWAYAGFGITFISAFIAHVASGDPTANIAMPLVFLAVLAVSYIAWERRKVEGSRRKV